MSPAEFRALPVGARVRLLCVHGSLDWRVGRIFPAGLVGVVGPLLTAPECCRFAEYRHVDFSAPDGSITREDDRRAGVIADNVESVS